MTQAEREQENGKEKEKEREKEKEKEQRGVKRPIVPAAIAEPLQEVILKQQWGFLVENELFQYRKLMQNPYNHQQQHS